MAKEAAETVVLVIDEEGIEPLLSELVKGVSDSQVLLLFILNGIKFSPPLVLLNFVFW